jgi:IclR family pca regulon transcriptional regulator
MTMPDAAMPDAKSYSEALARGIHILTAFGPDTTSLTLAEVARIVGLPRATARRALITLVHLGYVHEERRQFRLTSKVMEFAAAYLSASPATSILQPVCEQLAAAHNETFSVAVLEGADAVMVAYARPRRIYADSIGIGLRIPAFCSAVGRAILSGRSTGEVEQLLASRPLEPLTSATITDPQSVMSAIGEVRREGYAVVAEEVERGFTSMAVPMARLDGRIAFALNVGMPSTNWTVEVMQERYLGLLKKEAAALQRQLI